MVYCKSDLSLATEIGRITGFGGYKKFDGKEEALTIEYSLCPTHAGKHLHACSRLKWKLPGLQM